MERVQSVIDWFTDRGGKYGGDSSPAIYRDENGYFPYRIEHTDNHEIQYRGLQIFIIEVSLNEKESIIALQFLLDHGRNDDDDDATITAAIELLEPLLPKKAEFELSCSLGTDIFLLRDLEEEDLEPAKLDEILTTLTKFAEYATTKVSILHIAPEFKLKSPLNWRL